MGASYNRTYHSFCAKHIHYTNNISQKCTLSHQYITHHTVRYKPYAPIFSALYAQVVLVVPDGHGVLIAFEAGAAQATAAHGRSSIVLQ